jgi:small subunit ribosomal protein S1
VVTFGAFVEILDGVEGLVHISELAQHHVENPREIIQPGDNVRVKILEIDSERRRLSLSIKRVEGQELPVRPIMPPTDSEAGDLDNVPELGLSEEVFASENPAAESAPAVADAPPEPSEVAGAPPEASEVAGAPPEASEVADAPPEASEVADAPPEASEVVDAPPEPSEQPELSEPAEEPATEVAEPAAETESPPTAKAEARAPSEPPAEGEQG